MKFISEKAASKAYPSKLIGYVMNENKLCFDEGSEPLIATIGLDDSRPYSQQFRDTAELNGSDYKPGERKTYHFKYTVHPEDYSPDRLQKITPRELLSEAEKFTYENFPGYQAVITIQYHGDAEGSNDEHLHAHIVVNAFSYEGKNKLRVANKDLDRMRDYAYEAGLKYNLSERNWRDEVAEKQAVKDAEKVRALVGKANLTQGEQVIKDLYGNHWADHSWKEQYRIAIEEAKEIATSREAFRDYLDEHFQIKTQITGQGNIKYKMPDRQTYSSGKSLGMDYMLPAVDAALAKNLKKGSDLGPVFHASEWGGMSEHLRKSIELQQAEQRPGESRETAEIRMNRSALEDTAATHHFIVSLDTRAGNSPDNLHFLRSELEQQERRIRAAGRMGTLDDGALESQEQLRREYLTELCHRGDAIQQRIEGGPDGTNRVQKSANALKVARELRANNIAEMQIRVTQECSRLEREIRALYKQEPATDARRKAIAEKRDRQKELKNALNFVAGTDVAIYETEPEMRPEEKKKSIEWIRERREKNNLKAEETFSKAEELVADRIEAQGERYSREAYKDLNGLLKKTSYLESDLQTELDKLDRLMDRWGKSKDPTLDDQERRKHAGYVKWCGCDPNSDLEYADLKAEREVILAQKQTAESLREAMTGTAQRWKNANDLSYAEGNLEWTQKRKKQLQQSLNAVKSNRKKLWEIYINCEKAASRKIIGTAEWEKAKHFKDLWREKVDQEIEISRQLKAAKRQEREDKAKIRKIKRDAKDLPPTQELPHVAPQAPQKQENTGKARALTQADELREWSDQAVAVVSQNSFYGADNDLRSWAEEMEKRGCKVRITANTVSLTHPEAKQAVRTNRLGRGYEKSEIIARIQSQRTSENVVDAKRETPERETRSQTMPTHDFRELIKAQTEWINRAQPDSSTAYVNPFDEKAEKLKTAIEKFKSARENELAAASAVRRSILNRSSKKEELEEAKEKCREAFSELNGLGIIKYYDKKLLTGEGMTEEQYGAVLYNANAVLKETRDQAAIENKRRNGQNLENQKDLAEAKKQFEALCRTVPAELREEAEKALKAARGDVEPKIDLELKLIYKEIARNREKNRTNSRLIE